MFIEMKVAGLCLDPVTNTPVVILKDLEATIAIPIWVGPAEAHAIAVEMEKIKLSRPMTHDLLRTLVDLVGAKVERVEVNDLRDNAFYSSIFVEWQGRTFEVDARPSDAIALSLRTQARIFVARKVLESSRLVDLKKDKWTEILEAIPNEAFGRYVH